MRQNRYLEQETDYLLILVDNEKKTSDQKVAIFKTLYKKYLKGTFDINKAHKAFSGLTDQVARYANKHYEDANISVPARRKADKILVKEFLMEVIKLKNYSWVRH